MKSAIDPTVEMVLKEFHELVDKGIPNRLGLCDFVKKKQHASLATLHIHGRV
jgi:hypothetical protein